jgi:hypothetical protein
MERYESQCQGVEKLTQGGYRLVPLTISVGVDHLGNRVVAA